MTCNYCKKQFNNMEIGKAHVKACRDNPHNKGATDYRLYLEAQRYRFRVERWADNQGVPRKKEFIRQIIKAVDMKKIKKALIVGAADTVEKGLLEKIGIKEVFAIDLNSHTRDIMPMDMHDLKFADNEFDLVIASHSLEHSYNYNKAVQEIFRVLKPVGYFACEVPVNYPVNDIDRVDFESSANLVDQLKRLAGDGTVKAIKMIDIKHGAPRNYCATDVVKVVVEVKK